MSASNVSEIELLVGEITSAVAMAERSIALANQANNAFLIITSRAIHANALHATGDRALAERIFNQAEQRQKEFQPEFPLLYSISGAILLRPAALAGQGCRRTRSIGSNLSDGRVGQRFLLSTAVDILTLGRAHLAIALAEPSEKLFAWRTRGADATHGIRQAPEAIEHLRASERNDQIPRGLLARAAFRRTVGDWAGRGARSRRSRRNRRAGPDAALSVRHCA